MTALALSSLPLRLPELNWRRISAYSGSFSLHLIVILALLLPPTAMEIRRINDERRIDVTLYTAPPEVKAEPRLPDPPTRHREVRPSRPVITITAPIVSPVQMPASAPMESTAPSSTQAAAESNTGAHAAPDAAPQALGYGTRTAVAYPREALLRREQGVVRLRVLVGADGSVQQIEIDRTSGSHALDNAARDAVSHWKFKPGIRDGIAYAAWALVPISFTLPQ